MQVQVQLPTSTIFKTIGLSYLLRTYTYYLYTFPLSSFLSSLIFIRDKRRIGNHFHRLPTFAVVLISHIYQYILFNRPSSLKQNRLGVSEMPRPIDFNANIRLRVRNCFDRYFLQPRYLLIVFTEESHRDKIAVIYITDTMGLLIGSCVVVTLIVGFAAGYLCSRHFRADPYANVSLHPNLQLNR